MFRSVVFFVALAIAAVQGVGLYSGAQVLRISTDQLEQVRELIAQSPGLNIWSTHADHVDVLVPASLVEQFKKTLEGDNLYYEVLIPDVEKVIEEENIPARPERRSNARNAGYRMNWSQFHRLDVINEFMDTLARNFPRIASVHSLGVTAEQRPLRYIRISSGRPNAKAVFIEGGVHAREWASPAAVTFIIRELVENRSRLPADIQALDFYILPVFNPDGYEFTHTRDRMWRKNRSQFARNVCVGADVNRNFDFMFGGQGTSGSPCSDIFRGRAASSELETQALSRFLQSLRGSLKAYISFHSYGQYILIPYGYENDAFPEDFAEMRAVGEAAARAIRNSGGATYTVGHTANTLYPAAGGSDDWVKARIGAKYVYTIELRDTGRSGFLLPASEILPTAREAFEAVRVIASAAARA